MHLITTLGLAQIRETRLYLMIYLHDQQFDYPLTDVID